MLELHAADRAETLVDLLVDVLSASPVDPFEREWVAVPSIGMRRWLSQQLARRLGATEGAADGISANIHLPFPAELRQLVLDGVSPDEPAMVGDDDPWQVDRLVWAVIEVLHGAATDPLLRPLAEIPAGGTLLGRARRLADLLDRYSVHRPGLIQAWANGHDVGPAGERLDADLVWQPHLFRRVRDRVGRPSPPERLPGLLRAIESARLPLALPPRIALFGLSTMPPDLGPLLGALAVERDVRVFILSLSPALTRATMASAAAMTPAGDDGEGRSWSFPRRDDPTVDAARHPLLRSWAQPSREFAGQMGAAGMVVIGLDRADPAIGPAISRSLLERVQADVRANASPDGSHPLHPTDRSIQVHACSGPTRQVEALRDAICGLLAADPSLTEGDIVVMSPRLETFAPLIEAVFGPSAGSPGASTRHNGPPALRYRITDRSLRDRNPVLGALDALLEMVSGRFTASAVTELLTLDPVRHRFGLVRDDLSLLDRWIGESHIRWGLDGRHRASWGIPGAFSANTWEAGLDQLLMGVALADGDGVLGPADVVPLAVEGSDTVVVGRFARAVRTIGAVADGLAAPRPIDAWCDDLTEAADLLFAVPFDSTWERRRLDALLARIRDEATLADGELPVVALTLSDVRRLLREHLEGDPARAAFGTGAITMCSLQPLRSVPHRVVCILGLDQDSMPRGGLDGDDLLAQQPDVGDREPRAEARQLLLEALMAARDTVVVTFTGTDIRTNQPAPPAVVLDELWDCLAETVGRPVAEVLAQLRIDHPRQAFDPANFVAPPRSFDPIALAGARAYVGRPSRVGVPEPLVPVALAPSDRPAVDLAELRQFLRHPVRSFFLRRLEVRLPRDEPGASDNLPVRLEPLEGWALGEGLLEARRRGLDPHRWLRVEQAKGGLPPASLGVSVIETASGEVAAMVDLANELGVELSPRDHHPIDISVSGLRIVGSVGPCADGPHPGPVTFTYSRAKPSHRLALWLDLLVLTLVDPGTEWRAVGLSRNSSSSKKNRPEVNDLRVAGHGEAERRATALEALEVVVALYRAGMTEPLPIFDKTTSAIARGDRPKAVREWQGSDFAETHDAHHRLAFGDRTFPQIERLVVGGRSTAAWAALLWQAVDRSLADPDPEPGLDPNAELAGS